MKQMPCPSFAITCLLMKLEDKFDHIKNFILPQANYDWMCIRLQNYETIIEYNSILQSIESQLTFCKVSLFCKEREP